MADIKTINVNGTSYNINLPDNSTVNGLTVTGTLTAPNISGTTITATTANLTNINSLIGRSGTKAYFDILYPKIIDCSGQTLTISGGSLSVKINGGLTLSTNTISLQGQEVDITYTHINAGNAASEI